MTKKTAPRPPEPKAAAPKEDGPVVNHHHHALVVCAACADDAPRPRLNLAERRRKAYFMLVRRTPQAEVVAATGFSADTIRLWACGINETLAALRSSQEVL